MRSAAVSLMGAGLFLAASAMAAGSDEASIGSLSLSGESPALKVLAIGNSFSVSTQQQLPQVAKSLGCKLDLVAMTIGGCSLERHWMCMTDENDLSYGLSWNRCGKKSAEWPELQVLKKPVERTDRKTGNKYMAKGANLLDVVTAVKWDVITVQQASHLSWRPESYQPWGDLLVAKIRELAPQAEIVVQETWSYTPWDRRLAEWEIDQDMMFELLHGAYAAFAEKNGFRVIPTGTAVQLWRKELPVQYTDNSFGGDVCGSAEFKQDEEGKWKPSGDVFHLNDDGYYLQALVWAAALFGKDVTTCAYAPDGLDAGKADLMRRVAMEAVGEKSANETGNVLPDFSSRNAAYVVSYPSNVASRPQMKGVMLPSRRKHALTDDDFETLREWGVSLLRYQVRLPNDGALPPSEYLGELKREIEYFRTDILPRARANGMMVVFDLHDAPGGRMRQRPELAKKIGAPMNEHWMYRDRASAETFVAAWKMAAEALKGNEDVIYGYDLLNEPYQKGAREFNYYDLQHSAALAIRERDPATTIVFEANGMCSAPHYKWLSPLPLDNVIYEVHNYWPEGYTHQGVGGRPYGFAYPNASKGWGKEGMRAFCGALESFSRRHGAKVLVGEFSAAGWGEGADEWIRDMAEVMDELGWDWCYHAFREWYVWDVERDCSHDGKQSVPTLLNGRKRELLNALRRKTTTPQTTGGDKNEQ